MTCNVLDRQTKLCLKAVLEKVRLKNLLADQVTEQNKAKKDQNLLLFAVSFSTVNGFSLSLYVVHASVPRTPF